MYYYIENEDGVKAHHIVLYLRPSAKKILCEFDSSKEPMMVSEEAKNKILNDNPQYTASLVFEPPVLSHSFI